MIVCRHTHARVFVMTFNCFLIVQNVREKSLTPPFDSRMVLLKKSILLKEVKRSVCASSSCVLELTQASPEASQTQQRLADCFAAAIRQCLSASLSALPACV